ncbi:ABC transporter permease [Micromonospora maris]|uniref:ABC transporter permease n=1 Tax=Micromonospora maris TaxID=1003110 RepID=UPI000206BD0A|nr:ABC transporter permease [Micromonospora maris]AEB47149.1 binding-protein-dependent transport systems inner membrane component [Micromonospora maris AB-18-032]
MSLSPVDGAVRTGAGDRIPTGRTVGRSPGRLAWMRLRRDRTALVSGAVLGLFVLVALAAPLIEAAYGIGPHDQFQSRLDGFGMPLGHAGGVSGEHFFGLEPRLGRDIFIRLVYGLRTSFFVACTAAVLSTVIGAVLGGLAGYLGGWLDAVVSWLTDLTLAMPFLIVALALTPTLTARFYGQRDEVPPVFGVGVLIAIFAVFGWTSTARLVRGQVVALREREFVAAARASGAGLGHLLVRQLLPNTWAPILVSFSFAVPQFVTGEAALSFIGVGLTEQTPSFGRMIYQSLDYLQTDPAFVLFPGGTLVALVFAFNLFGDALRDALDPRSAR